jgi:hypothetical protein
LAWLDRTYFSCDTQLFLVFYAMILWFYARKCILWPPFVCTFPINDLILHCRVNCHLYKDVSKVCISTPELSLQFYTGLCNWSTSSSFGDLTHISNFMCPEEKCPFCATHSSLISVPISVACRHSCPSSGSSETLQVVPFLHVP